MKYLLAFNIGILVTFGIIHPEWNYGILEGRETLTRTISIWLLIPLVFVYLVTWDAWGDDE